MNDMLKRIVQVKRQEVNRQKERRTTKELEESPFFKREPFSMVKSIVNGSGIIAEIKRKSPSRQWINKNVSVEKLAMEYERAGVSGLSVLTDTEFFGGSNEDLVMARTHASCPIVRKEFLIDEYQVLEAKAIGADVILLIAAILPPERLKHYANLAHELGMEVLVEVHRVAELASALDAGADLIGVNNRDLDTFEVSLETSRRLAPMLPVAIPWVSESGIGSPQDVIELLALGYKGFLIGEKFMKHDQPGLAAGLFIENLAAAQKH